MKCIVTGGAGFIGSHIVDRLIEDGNEVISLDNESASSNEEFYWNQKAHKAVLDICDYDKIEPLFKDVDCVFHLAAEARIQPAIKNPQRAVLTNVLGTCNVLQASRENGVGRVLYSSTSSAYGLCNTPPLSEDMPNDCLNPYSVTKVSGEGLCNMYNKLYGLKTLIFRYFNVYGERQPVKGQYAPVVGIFLRQFDAREPLTIVGDGLQRRDFTYVQDVVEANILASETDSDDIFGQTINIGVGRNHSILDIAKMIGYNFKHLPERLGEARITLANIDKARELLGWKPEVGIEDWIGSQKLSGLTMSPKEWMKQL
jgi:UDP-glucose 4-epimerase|tara:strand:- start:45 stop:986 length:942 start_codon:yes stop_codon:yes gene_type:complete